MINQSATIVNALLERHGTLGIRFVTINESAQSKRDGYNCEVVFRVENKVYRVRWFYNCEPTIFECRMLRQFVDKSKSDEWLDCEFTRSLSGVLNALRFDDSGNLLVEHTTDA